MRPRTSPVTLVRLGPLLLGAVLSACGIDNANAPRSPQQPASSASVGSRGVSIASTGAYDASLGTLPQAQGWIFATDAGNPVPTVTAGVLTDSATAGAQYWNRADPTIDFGQDYVSETVIKIDTSSYVPSTPSSHSLEGYYLAAADRFGREVDIGLTDSGFTVNSLLRTGQPLNPFILRDGKFHTFRLVVQSGSGTLFLDGSSVAAGFTATLFSGGASGPAFGAISSLSRSITELKSSCWGTSPTDCLTDLALSLVQPVPTFNLNQNATVNFLERNFGPRPSTSARFFIAMPRGFQLVSSSNTSCVTGMGGLTCSLGAVVAGGQQAFSLTVKPVQRGTFTFVMSLTGQETDGVPGNNMLTRMATVH